MVLAEREVSLAVSTGGLGVGGGLYVAGGNMQIKESVFADNEAIGGSGGDGGNSTGGDCNGGCKPGGNGGTGGDGYGGAIFLDAACLSWKRLCWCQRAIDGLVFLQFRRGCRRNGTGANATKETAVGAGF
jgi:hypothetical protein